MLWQKLEIRCPPSGGKSGGKNDHNHRAPHFPRLDHFAFRDAKPRASPGSSTAMVRLRLLLTPQLPPCGPQGAAAPLTTDVDGNTFLDFSAGIAVVATGHCHPGSRVAAIHQCRPRSRFTCPAPISTIPNMAELARKLGGHRSRQGAQARLLRQLRHRSRWRRPSSWRAITPAETKSSLSTGASMAAPSVRCSLTASKAVQRRGFGSLLAGVFHVPYPNPYRCPYGKPAQSCCTDCAPFIERELFQRLVPP